jgi:processive 1,2-diacylglycerol beta-glucosyltransferase
MPPLVTVVTDSISVHPSWTAAPSDLICVADEETQRSVVALGVCESSSHVTGFPVRLSFMHSVARDHEGTRILYMPSTPPAHVAATLDAVLPLLQRGIRLTLQTGRHAPALYQTIRRFMDAHPDAPVDVIGWTDQLPRYLQTHDILICKAGGAILHEALAARIPAIIDYVVPGQEEGNAELLLAHHCAVRSHSPQETARELQRLLDNNLALATSMRSNMRPLSVPDAALRVADLALSLSR